MRRLGEANESRQDSRSDGAELGAAADGTDDGGEMPVGE